MEITFLGTGPTDPVPENKNGRTNSSVFMRFRGHNLLIDCTPQFTEQAERENVDRIDSLLITHAHQDAIGGLAQLHSWLIKKDTYKIDCYCESETYDKIKEDFKELSFLNVKLIELGQQFLPINDLVIIPFRLEHSIQPGFPMVGYRLNNIIYAEDVGDVPEISKKYFRDARVIIFDAAMWFDRQIKGHQNVESSLAYAKEFNPDTFVMMQAGHTYPPQDQAETEINAYWNKVKDGSKTNIVLAYDGLKMRIRLNLTEDLQESKEGIYLVYPHGQYIWNGEKSLIVKSINFKDKVGKLLYLLEDSLCYGLIRLKSPDKVNLDEFKSLADKHKITDEERVKWWKGKEVLYAYPFDTVKMFQTPKRVKVPLGVQTFVKDFEFLQEMIIDVDSYDATKQEDAVLRDDWRIVIAWYSSIRKGLDFKYTIDDVIRLTKKIYRELKKRGTNFNPERYTRYGKELFKIISSHEMSDDDIDLSDKKWLDWFEDAIILKDVISVCGSSVRGYQGQKAHDLDLHIRMQVPTPYLKRAIETRLYKMFPLASRIHMFWGDPEGPHDSYIPLYNLKLERVEPRIVTMSQDLSLGFFPMKPKKRFYEIKDLLDNFYPGQGKYAVEKKINGFRLVLVKNGDSVNLYSDEKRDITNKFPKLVSDAKQLTSKDIVLDGELLHGTGGRSDLIKYVIGKQQLDDSQITYHVFDILKINDEDLSERPWNERKSILHSLSFTDKIREVKSIMVDNKEEMEKAVVLVRKLKGSEGAVIKQYNGKYTKGTTRHAETDAWVKFRNMDTIIAKVIKRNPAGAGHTFTIGLPSFEKLNPKYEENGLMVLGNTFVTEVAAEPGDRIKVNIEETWRHEFPDGTIRFSLHKPLVIEKTNAAISTWKDLDEFAVARGEVVIEHSRETTTGTPGIDTVQGAKIAPDIIQAPMPNAIYMTSETEGHKHSWTPAEEFTSVANEHKHEVDLARDLALEQEGHTHKLLYELAATQPNEAELIELDCEIEQEMMVVKRGDKWCVIHAHPKKPGSKTDKPIGAIIKCFPTKTQADAMHRAISISEARRRGEFIPQMYVDPDIDVDTEDIDTIGLRDVMFNAQLPPEDLPGVKKAPTRGEAASKFWAENWQDMYPADGKGRFVYQHHWRGLNEDEIDMSNEQLLDTDHSVHSDLRLEKDKNSLFGFTTFLGTAAENKAVGGDRLINMSEKKDVNYKVQGTWKQGQPHGWIDIGVEKPYVSAPGEIAATTKKFAKFFAMDHGHYEMGVWREHSFEFFMHGNKLKGRMMISYAPVGGGRIWLADFPEDQTPYAEKNKIEDIVKELKSKGQKWLIWAKPGEKPKKIDVEKFKGDEG